MILGIGSFVSFCLVLKWLPETIHPGVSGYEKRLSRDLQPKRGIAILNPLKSLKLLLSPVLFITVWNGSSKPGLVTDIPDRLLSVLPLSLPISSYLFLYLTSSYVISPEGRRVQLLIRIQKQYYDIDNELIIGAIFVPSGVGNMGEQS